MIIHGALAYNWLKLSFYKQTRHHGWNESEAGWSKGWCVILLCYFVVCLDASCKVKCQGRPV